MADSVRLKDDRILVLIAEGARRDAIGRALRKESYKPTFIGTIDTIPELLAAVMPATLLHDWPTVELTQAIAFHQKMAKMSEHVGLSRVLYVEALQPSTVAIASDTGIRRVISHGTNPTNLVSEISMALSSMRNMPELQKIIRSVQAGATYSQEEIDKNVENSYHYYPHDPTIKLEFGQLCLRRKEIRTAKMIAEALTEEQPQNVRAMNLLSRVLMMTGQTAAAIELLEKADLLSPLNVDRLLLLGDACFAAGKNKKSGEYYSKALELDQGSEKVARTGLARVKLRDGDINAAFAIIHESMSEEEAVSLFNNAAVHAAQTGQHEASLRLYQSALQAVKSDGLKAAVHFNLALAHERGGDFEEMEKNLKSSLKHDPGFDKAKRYALRLKKKKEQAAS